MKSVFSFLELCIILFLIASSYTIPTAAIEVDAISKIKLRLKGNRETGPIRVAVVDPFPWCYEIVFAVTYTFSRLGWSTSVFLDQNKYGGQIVMKPWYNGPIQKYSEFEAEGFDVIVFVDWYPVGTMPGDGFSYFDGKLRTILEGGFQGSAIVLLHEPARIFGNLGFEEMNATFRSELTGVLNHKQVQIATIAPHVAHYTQQKLQTFKVLDKTVEWFVPVFPFESSRCGRSEQACAESHPRLADRTGFVLQGKLEGFRRDYSSLFEALQDDHELLDDPDFALKLVGREAAHANGTLSPLDVPDVLEGKVRKLMNLNFQV